MEKVFKQPPQRESCGAISALHEPRQQPATYTGRGRGWLFDLLTPSARELYQTTANSTGVNATRQEKICTHMYTESAIGYYFER